MSDKILLAHGSGGGLSRELIENEIVPRFGEGPLRGLPDAACLSGDWDRLIFTTDSFVVQPLFFPGGNIGDLAVHGTVNDLAVSGGRPSFLSLALILEEGLELSVFRRILDSLKEAAKSCGVQVATGDTKVVGRGQCDGIFINTAGLGEAIPGFNLSKARISAGDVVIASGPLGDHGMAVLSVREQIDLEGKIESDTGPVHRLVEEITEFADTVKFMRDPTRGGAAAVLNELVENQDFGILLNESTLPFSKGAAALAEMLGLDLLHVASEGRVLAVCAKDAQEKITDRWRALPEGREAVVIGEITGDKGKVVMETFSGGKRLIDVPRGELLPRIC